MSSFGYSGTIAHALLQSAPHIASSVVGGGAAVRFRRRAFAWAEPTHPLLQHRLSAPSGCAALFRSPVAGPLHALMADHVVRGRIIFPGAGYLETARAACSATTSSSAAGAALNGVFFLQPLALEEGGAAWVECALLDSGTFEVRSGSGEAVVAVHCSGHWAAADAAAWRPLGLAAMRERCCNVADTSALYAAFLAMGIDYGPAFRALEAAWECGSEATARLRRRSSLAGTQVHPADLDNALQSTALLRRDGSSQETRLPFAVDSVLMRGPAAGVLWALASASGADAADVALGSDDGIGKAQLDGFISRVLKSQIARHWCYETEWSPLSNHLPSQSAATALVLQSAAVQVWSAPAAAADPISVAGRQSHLVFVASGCTPLPRLAAALSVVQFSASQFPFVPTWLVTPGAPASVRGEACWHAGLWGLARAVRAELPGLPLYCMGAGPGASAAAGLAKAICAGEFRYESGAVRGLQLSATTEPEVLVRGETCEVSRLVTKPTPISRPIRLELPLAGAVSNLQVGQQPAFSAAIADGEVELRVQAVGLNFRDVLIVLGEYPGNPGMDAAGTDVAGTTTAHGAQVSQLPVHGTAFGVAYGCLASFVRVDARLLVPKPAALSFETATALISTWGTVHVAFQRLGLRAGQRLLLHAAAGGVGLAAVEYAKWLGVAVDGTAGKPHKHQPLRQLGVRNTASSRDAMTCAFGITRAHVGRRSHAALNSLSLDFISLSAAMLGEGGAFEEIGKRGVWSVERARAAGVRCDVLDMATEIPTDPLWYQQRVLAVLADRADDGSLHGIPVHGFDLAREAQAAFRLLQSGRNLGKVVLRVGLQHSSPSLGVSFGALSSQLLQYTDASVRQLVAVELGQAYALLERLCQQYVQTALHALQGQAVPRWHHQLLLNWFKEQPPPPEPFITREEVLQAHPDLWPEVTTPPQNKSPSGSDRWTLTCQQPPVLTPASPLARWLLLSVVVLSSLTR